VDAFRVAVSEICLEIIGLVNIRKQSGKKTANELIPILEKLNLNNSFLSLVLAFAGHPSISTWYGAMQELVQSFKVTGRTVVKSALSFLIPASYLMVGKGTKLVKPTSVRRMGANMLIGPLYELQCKHPSYQYPVRASLVEMVECVRNIQKRIWGLGGKVYAGESAMKQKMQSDQKSKLNLEKIGNIVMLTTEDNRAIMEEIPKILDQKINENKILSEIEGLKKRIQSEQMKKQRELKESATQTIKEDEMIIDRLFFEVFLMYSILLMKKEDISVRLSALQKAVNKGIKGAKNNRNEMSSFLFTEDTLLFGELIG
jgi:hypothetical protein